MARVFRDVTEGELRVLNVLWDERSATIRQLTDTLYPEGTAGQYATVQKLLERLEKKGFVRRDRSSRAHLFRATIAREQVIGWGLQELANGLSGGSVLSLFSQLVKPSRLTDKERQALRSLAADLDRQTTHKRRR
ncbi:MAG: BlaI/MecI/CopY family transcriptional regulator [Planctomycetota bacterium]